MVQTLTCPQCSRRLSIGEELAVKNCKCGGCGTAMKVPPPIPKSATIPPEPFDGFDEMVEDELLAVSTPEPEKQPRFSEPPAPRQRTIAPRRVVIEFSPGNIFVATVANLFAATIFAVVIWIALCAWFGVPVAR